MLNVRNERLIDKLDVLGYETDLFYASGILLDGKSALGACSPTSQEIHIHDGMKFDQKVQTLIHELTHFIDVIYGLGLKEAEVHLISQGMYEILVANDMLKKTRLRQILKEK